MLLFLNNRSHKGFTLIEILIALALLSVVLAAIYSTFFLSQRAIEGIDESLLKLQESRRALDILKREMDSVFFQRNNESTGLKILDRDFYGKQASELTFTTFSPLRPSFSKISYYLEDKDGRLILFKKVELPFQKEESERVDILEDIEAFTIDAKYGDKWVKTWDTVLTGNLPTEIRISMTIRIKDKEIDLFEIASPRIGRSI